MLKIKQVIVMRKDLNMRKGKMCAQAAHASLGVYDKVMSLYGDRFIREWKATGMAKICVGVNSLEELIDIYNKGLNMGIVSYIVTDAGCTEFHGEPTITCLAFEPYISEDIDKITGELELL